jgi:hypothetical protein
MSVKQYDFIAEPRGDDYRTLLGHATRICDEAQLVVLDTVECSSGAASVLANLAPWLLKEIRVSAWSGTILHSGTARLLRYRLCPESATQLALAVSNLYDWVQPDRPEDLALMLPDGNAWLTTIAHERDGYLTMSDEQSATFLGEHGEFAPLLAPGIVVDD